MAFPEFNGPSTNEPVEDKDYNPSAETLVHDIDDERTLEEEEAQAANDQDKVQQELDDLKKESEMPIEELLAYYEKMRESHQGGEEDEEEFEEEEDEEDEQDEDDEDDEVSHRTHERMQDAEDDDEDDEDDEDYDYNENEDEFGKDWRRSIRVGSDFQAEVPDCLSMYGDSPPYQNEDRLMWTSADMKPEQIIEYLRQSSLIRRKNDSICSPRITQDSIRELKQRMSMNNEQIPDPALPEFYTEDYFQDEEQLLYLLLQCNYNVAEALRRRTLDPYKYHFDEPMTLWSEDECLEFELGLRTYGKDFRQIRENKVPTRNLTELVAFYYLWKKSERYDVYANCHRLDKKRSLTHPGTTDYMDNFVDDNNIKSASSASPSSPAGSAVVNHNHHQHQHLIHSNINNNSNLNHHQQQQPPQLHHHQLMNNSLVVGMNVVNNVEPTNDSGLATPSYSLSDSMSPNTPNVDHNLPI